MMRHTPATGLIVALCAPAAAYAASPSKTDHSHYVRDGAGFACVMINADYDKYSAHTPPPGADEGTPCLRIGPLEFGLTRGDAEKLLGQPVKTVNIAGVDHVMYGLATDATNLVTTYAVLTYSKQNRINSIQLTGAQWSGAWRFADITLGDSEDVVIAHLGKAFSTKASDDSQAVEWDYDPWNFSIEMKNERLSSILVWKY